jgi:hypothetical protein
MANQQVIISVLADVSKFSKRMRGLGDTFGSFAKRTIRATALVAGALGAIGLAGIKAAEDAKVADDRLKNIATSMGLFGTQTKQVTDRLSDYASKMQLLTGVDDESIKLTQAKLLTFKELAKTAGTVGGAFDRATKAAMDMAAAGFGQSEQNAVQLGKALQDPIKGITALRKSGITFTEAEQKKIKALVESGKLLEAQEMVLGAVEQQVGGTAEATAKASDKIKVAFDEISEKIGTALLPYVEDLAEAFLTWLQDDRTIAFFDDVQTAISNFVDAMQAAFDDPAVKETFARLNNGVEKFFDYLASPQGKRDIRNFAGTIASAFAVVNESLMFTLFGLNAVMSALQGNWGALNMTFSQFKNKYFPKYGATDNYNNAPAGTSTWAPIGSTSGGNPSAPGGRAMSAPVVVNFNAPVDSVSAGREIMRVITAYNGARGVA